MNFIEAMQVISDTQAVCNDYVDGYYYLIENGIILCFDKNKRTEIRAAFSCDEIDSNWSVYDHTQKVYAPKVNKLGFKSDVEPNVIVTILTISNEINRKWEEALRTFFALKSHPLAEVPTYDDVQYVIAVSEDISSLYFDCWSSIARKFTLISPCFSSDEDVKKAIKDIGEIEIIEMYKTFSGIYE